MSPPESIPRLAESIPGRLIRLQIRDMLTLFNALATFFALAVGREGDLLLSHCDYYLPSRLLKAGKGHS
jgi:hypothetical protein